MFALIHLCKSIWKKTDATAIRSLLLINSFIVFVQIFRLTIRRFPGQTKKKEDKMACKVLVSALLFVSFIGAYLTAYLKMIFFIF